MGRAMGSNMGQVSCGMFESNTTTAMPRGDVSGVIAKPRSIARIMRRSRAVRRASSPPAERSVLPFWIMAPNRLSAPMFRMMPNSVVPSDSAG